MSDSASTSLPPAPLPAPLPVTKLISKTHYLCITWGRTHLTDLVAFRSAISSFFGDSSNDGSKLDSYVKWFGADHSVNSSISWEIENEDINELAHCHLLWTLSSPVICAPMMEELRKDFYSAHPDMPCNIYDGSAAKSSTSARQVGYAKKGTIQRSDSKWLEALKLTEERSKRVAEVREASVKINPVAIPKPTPVTVPTRPAPSLRTSTSSFRPIQPEPKPIPMRKPVEPEPKLNVPLRTPKKKPIPKPKPQPIPESTPEPIPEPIPEPEVPSEPEDSTPLDSQEVEMDAPEEEKPETTHPESPKPVQTPQNPWRNLFEPRRTTHIYAIS